MSNTEHSWRLEDEEGNKMGRDPNAQTRSYTMGGSDIRVMMNGRTIGTVQPITFDTVYLGQPVSPHEPVRTRRRQLRMHFPNIQSMVFREFERYERSRGEAPSYISMNREAYESYYLHSQDVHYSGARRAASLSRLMGADVILNPHQELAVMALGEPETEMIHGGLYDEE